MRFYRDALGFAVTQRYGKSAVFLSAGGYHHHIALNTWPGEGAAPPPPGRTSTSYSSSESGQPGMSQETLSCQRILLCSALKVGTVSAGTKKLVEPAEAYAKAVDKPAFDALLKRNGFNLNVPTDPKAKPAGVTA